MISVSFSIDVRRRAVVARRGLERLVQWGAVRLQCNHRPLVATFGLTLLAKVYSLEHVEECLLWQVLREGGRLS